MNKTTNKNVAPILDEITRSGYALLRGIGSSGMDRVATKLGDILHVTDVKVDSKSKSLVTSNRALDFHTDHPRADYIVWHCIEQSEIGGETILADAEKAYLQLSSKEQKWLFTIRLFEHKVFPDDEDSYPLVSVRNSRTRFYYSYWLVGNDLSLNQREALTRFRIFLAKSKIAEIRLCSDDVLVVDNTRIFHGRRSFLGDQRFLKRYWVGHFAS